MVAFVLAFDKEVVVDHRIIVAAFHRKFNMSVVFRVFKIVLQFNNRIKPMNNTIKMGRSGQLSFQIVTCDYASIKSCGRAPRNGRNIRQLINARRMGIVFGQNTKSMTVSFCL